MTCRDGAREEALVERAAPGVDAIGDFRLARPSGKRAVGTGDGPGQAAGSASLIAEMSKFSLTLSPTSTPPVSSAAL